MNYSKDVECRLEDLRKYQEHLSVFLENECEAIRREIHDNISSTLYATRMILRGLIQDLDTSKSKASEKAEVIDSSLVNVIAASKVISDSIRKQSGSLHHSLYDSVNELVRKTSLLSKIPCDFEWVGEHHAKELRSSSVIFRSFQKVLFELLLNSDLNHLCISVANTESLSIEITVWSNDQSVEGAKRFSSRLDSICKELRNDCKIEIQKDGVLGRQSTIIKMEIDV